MVQKSGKLTSWGNGSWNLIIYKAWYMQTVVVWDFWTINGSQHKTNPDTMICCYSFVFGFEFLNKQDSGILQKGQKMNFSTFAES